MVRVDWRALVALGAASLGLFGATRLYTWSVEKSDPRLALIHRVQKVADPRHDLLVLTFDATELLAEARPVPAIAFGPPITDLSGFRSLFVLAADEPEYNPVLAQLGPETETLDFKLRKWDLADRAREVWSLTTAFPHGVHARRVGGVTDGACNEEGGSLHCNSPDAWNHLSVQSHTMGNGPLTCLFAHPQADGALEITTDGLPASASLVGVAGVDDGGYFATGAPVTMHIEFTPEGGGAPFVTDVVAGHTRGPTPYRLSLGGTGGSLVFKITTPNAGARQFCFTAVLRK